MAIITKSTTSGNWNATSSWVGGVVPTSVDDVIFDATSAGVILNVSSIVKSIDMTGFTGMLTASANLTVNGSTNSSGVSYTAAPNAIFAGDYAFTSGSFLFANTIGYKQNDTKTRWQWEYFPSTGGGKAVVLHSDFHIGPGRWNGNNTPLQTNNFKLKITSNPFSSFSRLYLYGSGGADQGITIATYSVDNLEIDINDTIYFSGDFANCGVKLISGTISSNPASLFFGEQYGDTGICFRHRATGQTSSFTKVGGTLHPNMMFGVRANIGTVIFDCDDQIPQLVLQGAAPTAGYNGIIRCDKPLNVKHLHYEFSSTFNFTYAGSISSTQFQRFLFSGSGGLSASNLMFKSLLTKSAAAGSTILTNGLPLVPRVPSLRFSSDATHKIGNFMAIGMTNDIMTQGINVNTLSNVYGTFSSQTASVPATIQLGNDGFTWGYGFRDLNFTSKTMYAINGTLQNTTGATTSYPTGGGGAGGGSFTFVN
jgi:hypothetical protein